MLTVPARAALRAAGLRATAARMQVLDAVDAAAHPLTHAELAALPGLAGLDEITLYRTLTTLGEAGLVHRVIGLDGVWRCAPQPSGPGGCPGNHPHFLCTGCRRMSCLVDQPLPRVAVPPGAIVHGRQFVAHGLCAACAAPADASQAR